MYLFYEVLAMDRWFKLMHLFSFALLAGFMAVTQWSLIPAQNRLSAQGYATLEQGMNDRLETLTPILMIATIVSGIGALILVWRRSPRIRIFQGIALACVVTMVISTLTINAPVNFAIDTWNAAAPPADWSALRDRWELGHTIRAYVGLLGLLSALVATIWDGA